MGLVQIMPAGADLLDGVQPDARVVHGDSLEYAVDHAANLMVYDKTFQTHRESMVHSPGVEDHVDAGKREQPDGTVLIDIGTNGEIILRANGGFYATSCATGPAFEGATIRHGMLAVSGAIDSFRIAPGNSAVKYTVIAGQAARERTGIGMPCRAAGRGMPKRVILAGSFGSHLAIDDLITLGLLPPVEPEKVDVVGNAAGAGAVMAAMDPRVREDAKALAQEIRVVELATDPDFQKIFLGSLSFPENEI